MSTDPAVRLSEMFGIFVIACVFAMVWFAAIVRRIHRVFIFRLTLAKNIFKCKDWEWRLAELDKIKFESMIWQLWRPLEPEEWWGDPKFLEVRSDQG